MSKSKAGRSTPRKHKIYMEGGGDHNPALLSEFKRAMSKLLKAAGVQRPPKVIPCGGRAATYRDFCNAVTRGDEDAWLLVDAEEVPRESPSIEEDETSKQKPVEGGDPWSHVLTREGDGWERPPGVTDDQLHLMTVTMETWLLSDPEALAKVFGPKLKRKPLPSPGAALEQLPKHTVNDALAKATRDTPSGPYGKGKHSCKVLARLDPSGLEVMPWARRFLDSVRG